MVPGLLYTDLWFIFYTLLCWLEAALKFYILWLHITALDFSEWNKLCALPISWKLSVDKDSKNKQTKITQTNFLCWRVLCLCLKWLVHLLLFHAWYHVTNRVSPTQHAMGCGPNGRHLWNAVDSLQPHSVVRAVSVCLSGTLQQLSNLGLTPTQALSPVCAAWCVVSRWPSEGDFSLRWFGLTAVLQMIKITMLQYEKWHHDNWCIKSLSTWSINERGSPFFSEEASFSVNWRAVSLLPESTLALCAPFKKGSVFESAG